MRGLIKTSASFFIVLGGAVGLGALIAAAYALSRGAASPSANYVEMAGLLAAFAGAASGASIVLVGGTAYLLASIDERMERALRATRPAQGYDPTERGAAEQAPEDRSPFTLGGFA